jgi:hypothetical protein
MLTAYCRKRIECRGFCAQRKMRTALILHQEREVSMSEVLVLTGSYSDRRRLFRRLC